MEPQCQCHNPQCKWNKYYEGLRGSWSSYSKQDQGAQPYSLCDPNPLEDARQIKGVFGVAWVGKNSDDVNYDLEYIDNPEAVNEKINRIIECAKTKNALTNSNGGGGNQKKCCCCYKCKQGEQEPTQVYNSMQYNDNNRANYRPDNDTTIEIQEIRNPNADVPDEIEEVSEELSKLTSKGKSLAEFTPCPRSRNKSGKCGCPKPGDKSDRSDRTFVITKKPAKPCPCNEYLQQYYAFFRRKNKYRKLIGLLIIAAFCLIAYFINYKLVNKKSCKFRLY